MMQLDAVEYPIGSGTYVSIGLGSDYNGGILLENSYPATAQLQRQTTRNAADLLRYITIDGRVIPISFFRDPTTSSVTSIVWNQNLRKYFDPGTGRSGTRYLRFLLDDGTTLVRLPVHITSSGVRPGMFDAYDVLASATVPYFETVASTSPTVTTSGTVTNGGNARAQPQIQITGAGAVAGVSVTLTDTTGNGLLSYPVAVAAGGTVTNQTWVLLNGVPVPFNGVTTNAVLYVDIPASGTAIVTILRATGVVNALFNTLDDGNLSPSANTGTTGASGYAWNTSVITTAPEGHCGVWTPAQIQLSNSTPASYGYGISAEASGGVAFTLNNPASGQRNDANGMSLSAGATITAITVFSRVTTSHDSGVRSFLRWRQYGQTAWTDAWTATTNASTSGTLSSLSADEVIAGIEYITPGTAEVDASILTSSVANPTLITTSSEHGFSNGQTVTIAGHSGSTPTINGSRVVTVKSATTFTIPVNVSVAGTGGTAVLAATPTDGATLTVDISSATATIASGPTASSASVTYTVLNGTLVNSTTGQTITFTNFMFANGLLTIDLNARSELRQISKPAGPTIGAFTSSDPVDLFSLDPGANSITESIAGAPVLVFHDTWI